MATLEHNKDLRDKNTFGLPWVVSKFIKIQEVSDIEDVINFSKKFPEKPVIVLGGGSNILPTKKFQGLVVLNSLKGIDVIKETKTFVDVSVAAGEDWTKFVRKMIKTDYSGIENLSLIPGSVGGAVVQNIGAYDQVLQDAVVSVTAHSLNTGKARTFTQEQCGFEYRNSIFKKTDTWFISHVVLRLKKKFKPILSYRDLEPLRGRAGLTPRLVSDYITGIRRSKLPNWHMIGTAGSFFKNPRIGKTKIAKLKKKYPDLPVFYNYGSTKATVPAGWLVQHADISAEDRAEFLYPKHSLVVINKYKHRGGAPKNHGARIKRAAERIAAAIKNDFDIQLESEVVIL